MAVTLAQLDHLAAMSEHPSVVLQVLPFTAADAPGQNGPAVLFEFSDGSPPVAYLEGWSAGQVVEDPRDVTEISTALRTITAGALSPNETRAYLAKIKGEIA